MDIENQKLAQERNIAEYNAEIQLGLSIITLGQNALKSAILINGGAAVALLAFIGNIWGQGASKENIALLAIAMRCFSLGVLTAAMGSGATYCCQHLYHYRKNKIGLFFQAFAVCLVIASYYYFYNGSNSAYDAFLKNL